MDNIICVHWYPKKIRDIKSWQYEVECIDCHAHGIAFRESEGHDDSIVWDPVKEIGQ